MAKLRRGEEGKIEKHTLVLFNDSLMYAKNQQEAIKFKALHALTRLVHISSAERPHPSLRPEAAQQLHLVNDGDA